MKRIWKALSAFALSLALILSLSVLPACAAEIDLDGASSPSGYLVMLRDAPISTFSADPFAAATLMAAMDEREQLLELAGDWGIYKAAQLDHIRSLVYAGQVAAVEPDYQVELSQVVPVTPNDPYLKTGEQLNLTGSYGVNICSAWEAGLTGEGVTVAVIDSGLNLDHVDRPAKIGRGRYFYYRESENGRYTLNGKNYDFVSSGVVQDDVGHGTMVCGLIAAQTNNGFGVSSMAPGVTILPIRCFTQTKNHLGGYTSNLIAGLDYAVANGADVINMSWGLDQESASLKTAVDKAYQAGCILIAAAGNDGKSTPQYPAAWDNVISVGATDDSGRLTSYSQRVTSVNVCAPGGSSASGSQKVTSLGISSPTSYRVSTGTSFSTPLVSGAAALLLQAVPTMTQGDFVALLKATSQKITSFDSDSRYAGFGRMDVQELLDAVGYAGCDARQTKDGVTAYASYHPTKDSGIDQTIAVAAGYNAAGHLVESHSASLPQSSYHNCAQSFTFTNPTITQIQVYYLDPTTLSALSAPVVPVIQTSNQ